jgi:hypothetical protein
MRLAHGNSGHPAVAADAVTAEVEVAVAVDTVVVAKVAAASEEATRNSHCSYGKACRP